MRPCNELDEKRCCECGRRGVKAFVRERVTVAGYACDLWRCSNKGRCGQRGLDLQAALGERYQAFLVANPGAVTPSA